MFLPRDSIHANAVYATSSLSVRQLHSGYAWRFAARHAYTIGLIIEIYDVAYFYQHIRDILPVRYVNRRFTCLTFLLTRELCRNG